MKGKIIIANNNRMIINLFISYFPSLELKIDCTFFNKLKKLKIWIKFEFY